MYMYVSLAIRPVTTMRHLRHLPPCYTALITYQGRLKARVGIALACCVQPCLLCSNVLRSNGPAF